MAQMAERRPRQQSGDCHQGRRLDDPTDIVIGSDGQAISQHAHPVMPYSMPRPLLAAIRRRREFSL
ncbi:hypothetical protein ACYTTR_14755, partial [Cobetia marina]